MKYKLFLFPLIILLFGFSNSILQEGKEMCNAYIPLVKGTKLEYQDFDAKDKLNGIQTMTVIDVIETATSLTVNVNMVYADKKGKDEFNQDMTFTCEDGVFKMGMESFMNPEMMEGFKDMEIKIEQEHLFFPSNMEVGQLLPDAHLKMEVLMNEMSIMSMNVEIVNRKVEALETIETDAGSFPCVKVSYTTKTKMSMMDVENKTIEWLSPNVGVVRSESYNKKGELESYRLLTSISVP